MDDRRAGLQALIEPTSVAIVGASDDPARIGGRPLRYMLDCGYAGPIYPVNPNRATVQGQPAFMSVSDIGQPIDCALIAVPAKLVRDTLQACADAGAKSAIVFSSGFAEVGGQGEDMQAEVAETATRTGVRVLGPNCLGVLNFRNRFFATFSSTGDSGYPGPGNMAIISQSGAYGTHLFGVARNWGIGVSHVITTGNEADVTVAECIDWAVDTDGISVISAYAEGTKDGPALIRSLEKARAAGKPVIFMKVGRTELGAAAAASHTASLAGADEIYDAVFRQHGVYRAETTEDMLDAAYACGAGIYPRGRKVGIVTISGGVGVQMADHAIKHGLDVAPMPKDAQKRLKELLPFSSALNPVDTTAQFFNDLKLVGENFNIMLAEGKYDIAVAFFTLAACSPYVVEPLLAELNTIRERFPDRLLILSLMGPPEIVQRYRDAGYLTFEDPCRAIAAAAAVARIGEAFDRKVPLPAVSTAKDDTQVPRRALSEWESRTLFDGSGVPVIPAVLATDAVTAGKAQQSFGGPVAMKINGPEFAHKTDIGGVRLGIGDAAAASAAYDDIIKAVAAHAPDTDPKDVIVAPMIAGGVEAILGVQVDPVFGPAVMFGLGGVFVEVFRDVSFRLAPFDAIEARRMIAETKGAKLLAGERGAPPADVDALVQALVDLSRFAARHAGDLESIDLNPVIVLPEGEGAVALDCLVVPRRGEA